MAVLVSSSAPPFLSLISSSSSSSSSTAASSLSVSSLTITVNPFSRLHKEFLGGLHPKWVKGCQINTSFMLKDRSGMIVKASIDADGTETGSGGADSPSEGEEEEAVGIENLPLESKLQLKLEQKMRMKLAKKIRLRRKKLVRKRRLRKKGRWPPSKMKKNKNV